MQEITTYREFQKDEGIIDISRRMLRTNLIRVFSVLKSIQGSGWIKMPYYHHVFDDERNAFKRQLTYLKKFGDFISMDSALEMLTDKQPIDGRYFCLSFDDGFANCYTNMLPITSALDIPVIIYLPTAYIDLDISKESDKSKMTNFYSNKQKLVPFLNWSQCREMLTSKVSFGSHTHTHANLMKSSPDEIEQELKVSKQTIEKNLGVTCEHFACPWGRINIDFNPTNALPITQQLGYKTFVTTNRGTNKGGDNPYLLKRDHLLAEWGNAQLKYFFGEK